MCLKISSLGREPRSLQAGSLSIVDKKGQIQQTAKLFEKMGISINPKIINEKFERGTKAIG